MLLNTWDRDRTMLMLNEAIYKYVLKTDIYRDRTMLMLNEAIYKYVLKTDIYRDRTMLMLNRNKINILFLHYILYILIFQSLI